MCKIFTGGTCFFSKVHNVDISVKELSADLKKFVKWAFQWKMQFNSDPDEQANEVIFSRKSNNCSPPTVTFNNNGIKKCHHQKRLSIVLNSKLDFKFHVDQKIKKCNKLIGLIRRLSVGVPRKA